MGGLSAAREAAVCGCGIGGLAVATILARAGWRVTAFDRFEAPSPIGSGFLLQPTGLAVLDELGLASRIEALGRPVRRFFGHDARTGRLVLDLRYDALEGGLRGLGVQRAAVFDALWDAAREAGVSFALGEAVEGSEAVPGGRRLLLAGGGAATFPLVIDALGQRTTLHDAKGTDLAYGALWGTLPWPGAPFSVHAGEQRYARAEKMIGVVPAGRATPDAPEMCAFFWSLRRRDLDAWRAAPLEAWKDEVRGLWPDTAPVLDAIGDRDALAFARYRHRTLRFPVGRTLVHLGDAWHATSPQLGQGANMALLDAYALGTALTTVASVEAALDAYLRARRLHVKLFQALSIGFTPLYQSDRAAPAWLRDAVLSHATKLPFAPRLLALTVTGLLGRPLRPLGLAPYATRTASAPAPAS